MTDVASAEDPAGRTLLEAAQAEISEQQLPRKKANDLLAPIVARFPELFEDAKAFLAREFPLETARERETERRVERRAIQGDGGEPASERTVFPSLSWRNAAQILRSRPPIERIRTGIAPLDAATRGGIPTGIVTLLQGPPGSAKTTLLAGIGLHAAMNEGAVVVAMFVDEGILAAAIRQGQQLGLDIRALEEGDPEALGELERRLANVGFYIADPDETTLEAEIAALAAAPPGRKKMLLVDSGHVVPCERAKDAQTSRAHIEAVVAVARAAALELPAAILMTAEVTKGSYASKNESENTADLAASAETRKLGYAARLILSLKEEGERIFKVAIPKNTPGLGAKPTFRLELDPARAMLSHIPDEQAEERTTAAKNEAAKTALEGAKSRVCLALRLATDEGAGWISTAEIERRAKGNAQTVRRAAERLLEEETVERDDRGPGRGVFWRLRETADA